MFLYIPINALHPHLESILLIFTNHCIDTIWDKTSNENHLATVCLFVFSHFFTPLENFFYLYVEVTTTGEGLKIMTFTRHSWPLSSEGSLSCHTYCDTALPFKMVISEDPWYSYLLLSECLAVELSQLVLTTEVRPDCGSNLDILFARRTLFHWVLSRSSKK